MRAALALQAHTALLSATFRLATALVMLGPPVLSVGFVAIARSGQLDGPSGAKFAPYAEGTYAAATAGLAGQIIVVVGVLAGGFAVAWLFGREWADATYGSLFALATTRRQLGWAKVAVAAAWVTAAVTTAMALTAGFTAAVDAAHMDSSVWRQLGINGAAGLVMGLLALPFGWAAVMVRGYLGALGAVIGVTAVSQILASLGVGRWVPYVAPALWAGADGPATQATVGPWQLAAALAFAAGGGWAAAESFARASLD